MYIYKITNNLNGNCYVGLKTSTVEESENYYGSGKLIRDAIKKYGKHNFNKEILVRDVDDFETLCELERYYIQLYDTKNKGYNMTDGGLGMYGYEPTEEHRKNMSKSLSGENHPQYGIKRSKETRLKLSEKAKLRKGRPVSEETRKKISESLKKRKI
jgi:group I intron endonuclease